MRADDEDAPGFEKGDRAGTSLDPDSLKNQLVYLKRVEIALSSQLQVPAVIPPDTLKRLKATVSFKVDAQGKVQGEPPFRGRLIHHGWEASRCEIPQWNGADAAAQVVAPAEVECAN